MIKKLSDTDSTLAGEVITFLGLAIPALIIAFVINAGFVFSIPVESGFMTNSIELITFAFTYVVYFLRFRHLYPHIRLIATLATMAFCANFRLYMHTANVFPLFALFLAMIVLYRLNTHHGIFEFNFEKHLRAVFFMGLMCTMYFQLIYIYIPQGYATVYMFSYILAYSSLFNVIADIKLTAPKRLHSVKIL